jgi:hypothetical protein
MMLADAAATAATPNPFDNFAPMFEQPWWSGKHHYVRKNHAHRPVAKASPIETLTAAAPGPATAREPEAPDAILPIPEPRPAEPISAAVAPVPPPRPLAGEPKATAGEKSPSKLAALTPPADPLEEKPGSAFENLAALGVKSVPLPAIEEGRCTVLDPVSISSLESGAVQLSSKAILNDRMAETFARWVHDDVIPAANDVLGGELTAIGVVGSYTCRSRYDLIGGGKMSEHGFANAIDVAGFRVNKQWIEVGDDKHNSADDARFLDAVRHAACRRFTTVLGPGQPLHDNHFHLDLEQRRNRYTICE